MTKFAPRMDVVITYVDGNDPLWKEDYAKVVGGVALSKRFRDWGTLRYLLRGIGKFIPYVRKVHLVVARDSQVPSWVNREAVHVVLHKDIIPEAYLPTFNSSMIEMFLHRIEGLDEQFLYFNDDMFPMRPLPEEAFFKDGKPSIGFHMVFCGGSAYKRLVFKSDALAREALGMRQGLFAVRPQHVCSPMLRSLCEDLFGKVERQIMDSLSPLRDKSNFNQYLFMDYMYYGGNVVAEPLSNKHFSLAASSVDRIARFIADPTASLACINDVNMSERRFNSIKPKLLGAFESALPEPSVYES